VANTLTTLWGFQAASCGAQGPRSSWTQRSGGASFLYNNVQADALLLRLNDTPPQGAFFSGWDASTVAAGTPALSIHHPQGDLKKVSEGTMQKFTSPGVAGGNVPFHQMLWSSGTTEGGSSGSGLWTRSGGQYLFRGGLWGGTALCSAPNGVDYYSRFDLVYPAIAGYLGTAVVDYTDLWWNPGESGWGLNLIQHPSRILFGVWYTYAPDGKRTWFVMPEGQWLSDNTYSGPVYQTAGPGFSANPFDASKVVRVPVGTARLVFSDRNNGTFNYTVNGVNGSRAITRQPF
jgi:lysyl endopeptidase